MEVNAVVDLSTLIAEVGKIGLLIQALGLVVILWIIFQFISLYFDIKRRQSIKKIQADMNRIEKKIDGIVRKIK